MDNFAKNLYWHGLDPNKAFIQVSKLNKSFIRVKTKEGSLNKGFITSHSMY